MSKVIRHWRTFRYSKSELDLIPILPASAVDDMERPTKLPGFDPLLGYTVLKGKELEAECRKDTGWGHTTSWQGVSWLSSCGPLVNKKGGHLWE